MEVKVSQDSNCSFTNFAIRRDVEMPLTEEMSCRRRLTEVNFFQEDRKV